MPYRSRPRLASMEFAEGTNVRIDFGTKATGRE